ncbi:MAG: hypothetical protein VR64_22335 [Desulfatitalea sp. BRH_c12]|nr:MAG: hypothetical protein VR64_22335 [Desulfatitalea sp. BRH_c12]
MKTVKTLCALFIVTALLACAAPALWASESWATDPDTGCKIGWVSQTYSLVKASWTGPETDGKAEGNGVATLTLRKPATRGQQGEELQITADGTMHAGKLDGKVSLKYSSGASYEGDYKMGVRDGKGIYKWVDGRVYDGDWQNDGMSGKGIVKLPDGSYYDGEWKNSWPNGHGIGVYPSAGLTFEGEFKDGKREGKGTTKWRNGQTYEGEAKGGLMHGKGILKYANGHVYEGEFSNDKINGYGTLKDASGKVIYEGQWKDNRYASGEQM